ncbi:MAG: hypothetical protein LH615_11820, partial [Ferruginibacter sp.]|nr:hypothetical protein [Ferruginibacter sp.]
MKKYIVPLLFSVVLFAQCSKKDSTPTASNNLNTKSVGASAKEFLSAGIYTSINVQLQYMPGFAPDAAALTNLTNFLNTLVNKPAGINFSQTPIAASGKSVFSIADISALEKANRTQFTNGNVLSVYIVYVDAPFTTANILGAAYRNTSLVVFGPTVISNSGGVNQTTRTKLETTVLNHEFGHLLGLTNLGTSMVTPHED